MRGPWGAEAGASRRAAASRRAVHRAAAGRRLEAPEGADLAAPRPEGRALEGPGPATEAPRRKGFVSREIACWDPTERRFTDVARTFTIRARATPALIFPPTSKA